MLSSKISAAIMNRVNRKRLGYQYMNISDDTLMKVHSSYTLRHHEHGVISIKKMGVQIFINVLNIQGEKFDPKSLSDEMLRKVYKVDPDKIKQRAVYYNNYPSIVRSVNVENTHVGELHYIKSNDEAIEVLVERQRKCKSRLLKEIQTMLDSIGPVQKANHDVYMADQELESIDGFKIGETSNSFQMTEERLAVFNERLATHNFIIGMAMLLPVLGYTLFYNEIEAFRRAYYRIPLESLMITDFYIRLAGVVFLFFFGVTVVFLMETLAVRGEYRRYVAQNIPSKRHLRKKGYLSKLFGIIMFCTLVLLTFDTFTAFQDDYVAVNDFMSVGEINQYAYDQVESVHIQIESVSKTSDKIVITQKYTINNKAIEGRVEIELSESRSNETRFEELDHRLESLSGIVDKIEKDKIDIELNGLDEYVETYIHDSFFQSFNR